MRTGFITVMLWHKTNGFVATSSMQWELPFFCHDCVRKALGVSKQRLSRQRQVKRRHFQQPEREMTKKEVDDQSLTSFVVMPSEMELCFALWWKDLPSDHKVAVHYQFERHGLAGRVLNSAKTDAKQNFLEFIDSNSQPNG